MFDEDTANSARPFGNSVDNGDQIFGAPRHFSGNFLAAFGCTDGHLVKVARLFEQRRADDLEPRRGLSRHFFRCRREFVGLALDRIGDFFGLGNDLGRACRRGRRQFLCFFCHDHVDFFNLAWRSAVTRLDMVPSSLVWVLSGTLTSSSLTKICSVASREYATLSSESARNACCILRLF